MTITQVLYDGIEFFTIDLTGEGGMSESGLARFCGVGQTTINNLLNPVTTNKVPEWLKPFLDEGFHLPLRGKNNRRIVRSAVCAAVIEYYAYDSRAVTAEAMFAFRKFAKLGIDAWIQSITGWKPTLNATQLTVQAVEQFILEHLEPGHCPIAVNPHAIIQMLQQSKFSADGYRLYLYLEITALLDQTPPIEDICEALDISLSTFKKWLPQVHTWSHCADWLQLQPRQGTEYDIQRRMHQELGGNIEVHTLAGRIDLVTDTEVIEIKKIANWKDAFGEVLAKGQDFPQHRKRIHLFGDSDKLMRTIVEYCTPMAVTATFERVAKDEVELSPWDEAA